jgi:DNA invertase Pin-like site-specific DNA recombinase
METKYVAYYRVSTHKQGADGLGIEAQKDAVLRIFGTPIMEYVEVESGRNNKRPKLLEALKYCKDNKAVLAIAKIDRLGRNLAFISNLMESGVDFKAADQPNINNFTVHILAAVAENEAKAISKRVKDALEVKKNRLKESGGRLGCPDFTSTGRTINDVIAENRKCRVYYKPERSKVETLVMLKESGAKMDKLIEVGESLFGRKLSNVTIYKYINDYEPNN